MTTVDSVVQRQAKTTSAAIAKFANISDSRTVFSLVLAGMQEIAKEIRADAPTASVASLAGSTPPDPEAALAPLPSGAPSTARRTTITPPSTMIVPFGNTAGRQLGTLTTSDVRWLEAAIRRALTDPAKEQYVQRNRGMLAQIEAELARRAEQTMTDPAGGG